MEENTMSENGTKQKKSDKTDNYVTTCRAGAVAANVFKRTAPGGFEYLDFSLSRSWKKNTDKEGYSQRFFAKNREAMKTVVDNACDYIVENSAAGKPDVSSVDSKRIDPRSPSA